MYDKETTATRTGGRPKGSYRWPLIVGGLLGGHGGAVALAVNIAGRDNGNAVLPDYYERALAWDEMRLKAADSALLGWDVFLTASPLTNAEGQRTVRVEILDRFREPVEEAVVSMRYWHRAEGKAREARLEPVDGGPAGIYEAALPMARGGLYAVDLAAQVGELLHVSERELDVMSIDLSGERSSEEPAGPEEKE